MCLKHVSEILKNDEDVVFRAVKNYGYVLKYAHERFKNNKKLILIALRTSDIFEHVNGKLKNDKEFILKAFKINPADVIYNMSDKLKDDEEFLYHMDQIYKLKSSHNDIKIIISTRIALELKNDPDYLLNFAPVYLKPARSIK